jgi:nuclear pore complex protein Nup85
MQPPLERLAFYQRTLKYLNGRLDGDGRLDGRLDGTLDGTLDGRLDGTLDSTLDEDTNVEKRLNDDTNLHDLLSIQQDILDHIRSTSDPKETAKFSGIHSIWNLAQIVFVHPSVPLTEAVTAWVNLNHMNNLHSLYQQANSNVHLLYNDTPNRDLSTVIPRLLLRGQFDPALKLLNAALDLPCLSYLQMLLKKLPVYSQFSSLAAFKAAWIKWNQEAVFAYSDGSLSSFDLPSHLVDPFATLFGILAGNVDLILAASHSWHEALVGILRFSQPLLDNTTINQLVSVLESTFDLDRLLDRVHMAILDLNVPATLKFCSQYDWWLVTHLSFVFEKQKTIHPEMQSILVRASAHDCTLAQWYRLSFADYLFSEPQMWLVAIGHFATCGAAGKLALNTVIPRIPIDSAQKLAQVIAFCDLHGLPDAKKSVFCIQGKRAFDQKDHVLAVERYLKAEKLGMVDIIVKRLLEQFVHHGDDSYTRLVHSLTSNDLYASPSLSFITRYYQFQKLYQEKQYTQAGDLLVLLLTSGVAPPDFWHILLSDAMPLVPAFNHDNLLELMRLIELVELKNKVTDANLDFIPELRLRLAQAIK